MDRSTAQNLRSRPRYSANAASPDGNQVDAATAAGGSAPILPSKTTKHDTGSASSPESQTKSSGQAPTTASFWSNYIPQGLMTLQSPSRAKNTDTRGYQRPNTQAETPKMQYLPNSRYRNSGGSLLSGTTGEVVAGYTLSEFKAREAMLQKSLEDAKNENLRLRRYYELYNDVKKDKSKLQHELAESRSREQHMTRLYQDECRKRAAELEKLQKSHDEKYRQLQITHAQSTKEINGGFEPITDEYIMKSFINLRDQIGSWCRKSWNKPQKDFFQQASLEQANLQDWGICLLDEPIFRLLNTVEILQGVTWRYIEDYIFGDWLYGFESSPKGELSRLEELLHDSAFVYPHTKPCEWRAYTISRLLHSPQLEAYRESLIDQDSKVIDEHLQKLCESKPKVSEKSRVDGLKSIIRSAATLAIKLRTQKADYSLDINLNLKDTYNPKSMEEVSFNEEEAELERRKAVVSCILSRGWIKVEDGLSVKICKASVRAL